MPKASCPQMKSPVLSAFPPLVAKGICTHMYISAHKYIHIILKNKARHDSTGLTLSTKKAGQAVIYEFKANLLYTVSSRRAKVAN